MCYLRKKVIIISFIPTTTCVDASFLSCFINDLKFSFLPIFKKLNKSETKTLKYIQPNKKSYTITNQGNVKIIPNPELELISFSSKLIFKKVNKQKSLKPHIVSYQNE